MNIFLYYFTIILLYLGIGQIQRVDLYAFRPINDIQSLANYINNHPASVVLTNISEEGQFLKTYSFDLLIIRPNFPLSKFKIKVSKKMAEQYSTFLGLSIANTQITDQIRIIYTPLPPGSLLVGNASLGRWEMENGKQTWDFFPQYAHLPEELGWDNFIPEYSFYLDTIEHVNKNLAYLGPAQEFGRGQLLTDQFLKKHLPKSTTIQWTPKDLFQVYFRWPSL
jgi:hypothetical protein